MKRSEMIKILQNSFIDRMNSEDIFTDEDMYSAILQDIENTGMLPPIRNADLKSSYGYARIYEWETE